MLTCNCDACGVLVPREVWATVNVRFGKSEVKFELCPRCQYAAVRFFEDQVGTEIMNIGRDKWTAEERRAFKLEQRSGL